MSDDTSPIVCLFTWGDHECHLSGEHTVHDCNCGSSYADDIDNLLQPCGTYHADDDDCLECECECAGEHHCSSPFSCAICSEARAEEAWEQERHS